MPTDKTVNTLIINTLTEAQYQAIENPSDEQLWVTPYNGGSTNTLTWYKNNTGTMVTISDTSSANLVKVYKNGILLEPTADYSISGTTLTMVTALVATDKIAVEVF